MMAKLLAGFGTMTLVGITVAVGMWGLEVSGTQYDLPQLLSAHESNDNVVVQNREATQRLRRPDVFYSAVTERPVFTPARRPEVPELVSQPTAVEEFNEPELKLASSPQLTLLGVMGNDGENRALVSNAEGDPLWVSVGKNIAGWNVENVGSDWLELKFETETIRIEMYLQ